MTLLDTILSGSRQLLFTVLLILLVLQMYLVITTFRDERKARFKILYGVHFLASFLLFYLMLSVLDWKYSVSAIGQPFPDFLARPGYVPASAAVLYEVISAVLTGIAFADLVRFKKNHLTRSALKEALDLLPVGISFSGENGTILFSNLTMNRISQKLTGRELSNANEFIRAAAGEQTEIPEEGIRIPLQDPPSVWRLVSRETRGRKKLIQLTASDMTKQAEITRDLEAKNKKLRGLLVRLTIYHRQAERVVTEQELLNARIAVHNELGNVLLSSRHYLKDPASYDESLLLQTLKNTNTMLLKEYEEDDSARRDPLAEALSTAEAIGVTVAIKGIPPSEEASRTILAAAITECAANTVKHAEGDRLQAEIKSDPAAKKTIFILQNNGIPPAGEIRETGGLLSLRALVENSGGEMSIRPDPAFRLVIRTGK